LVEAWGLSRRIMELSEGNNEDQPDGEVDGI